LQMKPIGGPHYLQMIPSPGSHQMRMGSDYLQIFDFLNNDKIIGFFPASKQTPWWPQQIRLVLIFLGSCI
jgi:hypothetical protein